MKTHRTSPTATHHSKSPINRNVRAILLVTLCLLPLLLTACDNFERDAYRALKLAKVEYELLQDHAARASVSGRITTEQWNQFAATGRRFIAAHTLTADLLSTYAQVKEAAGDAERDRLRRRIQIAMAGLPILLTDLHVLLDSLKTASDPAAVSTTTNDQSEEE